MDDRDIRFMQKALEWAGGCQPSKVSIPRVGAIIAVGDTQIGQGRRGTGLDKDDDHAELDALRSVRSDDKSKLLCGTLYTTLEPCTIHVRSNPPECCTEQILQHKIRKVFVGILDPNQGVTGKGLLRLQEAGVEVELFRHDLSQAIRIQNVDFIRTQQTLGAEILSPKAGAILRTFLSKGRHPVRFKCLNPPTPDTYLLATKGGLNWPQVGPFRQVDDKIWEIDAHFGSTGEHILQLVTADSLGRTLISYYRRVTQQNRDRRERLRGKIDMSLLDGDYPGIEMNGLPKGLRFEASVKVRIADNVNLLLSSVIPQVISRGKNLKITYEIECFEKIANDGVNGIWLGASFKDSQGKDFFNTHEDRAIALTIGKSSYERDFTIQANAPLGKHMFQSSVWRGTVGDSGKSTWVAGRSVPIKIVD